MKKMASPYSEREGSSLRRDGTEERTRIVGKAAQSYAASIGTIHSKNQRMYVAVRPSSFLFVWKVLYSRKLSLTTQLGSLMFCNSMQYR